MAMWRCPHCGTPQAETDRCWVCRRSSTSCGTCRHFRASVAAKMGYCGLDRRRRPLDGDEIRACWESSPGSAALPVHVAPVAVSMRTAVQGREFIEVLSKSRTGTRTRAAREPETTLTPEPAIAAEVAASAPPPAARWSLWEDLEG